MIFMRTRYQDLAHQETILAIVRARISMVV